MHKKLNITKGVKIISTETKNKDTTHFDKKANICLNCKKEKCKGTCEYFKT